MSENNEILRLRTDAEWLRQMLHDYRIAYDDHPVGRRIALNVFIHSLRQRADRAERILAALREPSAKVVEAATRTYMSWDEEREFIKHGMVQALRAAVAAAEQEVGP